MPCVAVTFANDNAGLVAGHFAEGLALTGRQTASTAVLARSAAAAVAAATRAAVASIARAASAAHVLARLDQLQDGLARLGNLIRFAGDAQRLVAAHALRLVLDDDKLDAVGLAQTLDRLAALADHQAALVARQLHLERLQVGAVVAATAAASVVVVVAIDDGVDGLLATSTIADMNMQLVHSILLLTMFVENDEMRAYSMASLAPIRLSMRLGEPLPSGGVIMILHCVSACS